MDEQDDEHYTSGEGAPASYIPKPVQFVVATACTDYKCKPRPPRSGLTST